MLNTSSIIRNALNALAFKLNKKIVVIESDDWGAVRMPSKEVYQELARQSIIDKNDPFLKYDCLECNDDLQALFTVLNSVQDSNGDSAKLTANVIMGNPDFDKMITTQFTEYHWEPVQDTFKKYPRHDKSYALWMEGKQKNIFVPQLHGHEHVNVYKWMQALQQKKQPFIEAAAMGTYALDSDIVAAFKFSNTQNETHGIDLLHKGIAEFERVFGKTTETFIAPNYTWNGNIERVLAQNQIKYLQGSKKQKRIKSSNGTVKSVYHYTGQKNADGQKYLVRNCLFEPSVNEKLDYVSICLNQIENSFLWRTPAIVGSHRLNYCGFIDERNRAKNLAQLQVLLKKIVEKWPDVVFMSTAELIKEIN